MWRRLNGVGIAVLLIGIALGGSSGCSEQIANTFQIGEAKNENGCAAGLGTTDVALEDSEQQGAANRADPSEEMIKRQEKRFADELARRGDGSEPNAEPIDVPVWFHVVTDSAETTGQVSDEQLAAQINQLNSSYHGDEAPGVAASIEFNFVFAGVDRWANDTWFSESEAAGVESEMKAETRVGGRGTLNVWTTGIESQGYSTFPWDQADRPHLDGVVILWTTLPGGSELYYDLGKTLVHETGHWFGLYHTFQGGCDKNGDYVDDTPAEARQSFGCPVDRDTCKARGTDPVHNYMDYSFDSCYNQFTQGQVDRMRNVWAVYRG